MQPRALACAVSLAVAATLLSPIGALAGEQTGSLATEPRPPEPIPGWLQAHVGAGEGQIAAVVLQRARDLYLQKTRDGTAKNPCYFAMDATRPSTLGNGRLGRRFYIVCEAEKSFRAISSGHGGGRHLPGSANFANGKRCARNFGNAMGSKLTTGGAYLTREQITSFKGYYPAAGGKFAPMLRTFVQFDGEGETANARKREIGGHAAMLLRGVCLRRKPDSPYADKQGFVPFGRVEIYSDGRSSGCTSWSPNDAEQIVAIVKDKPATLYIYPESGDIAAVAEAVKSGRSPSRDGLYWNAACLAEIRSPRFWTQKSLEPMLARYEQSHPPQAPRPTPMCAR